MALYQKGGALFVYISDVISEVKLELKLENKTKIGLDSVSNFVSVQFTIMLHS